MVYYTYTIRWLSEREDILNRQSDKINYFYGRLSHEDELAGDSNSIINHRKILEKYAEENGFTPFEFIYDDGYSGADFEWPAFSRMIEDVEAGKVATVIVKDMSRFGRDYLKVGFLTEMLFPEKDVRLIAVNDNVDTERGENDFTPMMNLFNEWFVRNTSKKIRAVWQVKGKSGERLAVECGSTSVALRAMANRVCSPAQPTAPIAAKSCTSIHRQSGTRQKRLSVTRAPTPVPTTARASSTRRCERVPATLSGKPFWNSLCWWNCGICWRSSRVTKSSLYGW